jgi:hypothetical protein
MYTPTTGVTVKETISATPTVKTIDEVKEDDLNRWKYEHHAVIATRSGISTLNVECYVFPIRRSYQETQKII